LPLTLQDAIRRALESNNDIEIERNNVRLAETTLQSLEGVYQPIFSVTPQYTSRVLPATRTFEGTGDSITTNSFSLTPAITKQFRTGGGRYDFFFTNSRDTATGGASSFSPSYQTELGVRFTQPLFRDRAIDNFRRDIRIQRKRLEQSDADFRRRVIEIIANVQNSYWELVFALRDQQNRIANLNLARENFRLTEARVAAGALAPLARAEVQTELSTRETELLVASQTVTQAENSLKQLLIGDPASPLWSAQILPTDEPVIDDTPVNLEGALAEARQNRPELRRLRLEQDVNDIDAQFLRNQTLPRVDIESTISTGGFAGTPFRFDGGGIISSPVPIIDPSAANSNANAFLFDLLNVTRRDAGTRSLRCFKHSDHDIASRDDSLQHRRRLRAQFPQPVHSGSAHNHRRRACRTPVAQPHGASQPRRSARRTPTTRRAIALARTSCSSRSPQRRARRRDRAPPCANRDAGAPERRGATRRRAPTFPSRTLHTVLLFPTRECPCRRTQPRIARTD
jgi:HAE1 family hydrophobic/amphiphilic exporter-1